LGGQDKTGSPDYDTSAFQCVSTGLYVSCLVVHPTLRILMASGLAEQTCDFPKQDLTGSSEAVTPEELSAGS
jgi:hypothetical protein